MADNEINLSIRTDAKDALSTLKDVKDAFDVVGGTVGAIGSLAIEAAEKIKQLQTALEHGTAAQKKAVQAELETLVAGYNAQLAAASKAIRARLDVVQRGLEEEKKQETERLVDATNPETGASLGITKADAQKSVTEEYRTRQSVIDSLRLTVLQLMQAETAETENIGLRLAAATTAQATQVQVITVQSQKNRIDTTQQGSQEVVGAYEKSFTAINSATQQFNNQQFTMLMAGINNNSAQIVQGSQQRFKKLEADESASLERRRKAFDRVFQGISGTFTSFINGMVRGNETLGQAWAKMVDDMASKFLSGLERQLMGFLEHKLMEVTIHAQAEETKDAVSQASHAKEGARSAATAAQHAYEWADEWGGPIAGAAAAAIAFAGVTAFGSAEGGQYVVPSEQLTMLHRNEMVLPAGVAERMRGVIESGGGRGLTVVVNHSVSAVDAESFQSHIRRHGNMIGNEVARVLRKKGITA